MKVAIVGAGFTPAEADALRRSMATFKSTGGVSHFRDKMIERHDRATAIRADFAERTFKQIEGFGSYGFPESHAASFAKIAYASSWMKHTIRTSSARPCSTPSRWASTRPPSSSATRASMASRCARSASTRSRWDCTLEDRGAADAEPAPPPPRPAHGEGPLQRSWRDDRRAAMDAPFASIEEVWRRSGVPVAALEKLADADAFAALGLDRRQACGRCAGLGGSAAAAVRRRRGARAGARGGADAADRRPRGGRGLSRRPALAARPSARLPARPSSTGAASSPAPRCATMKDGARVHVAGIVLVRQRPGAGNVTFITLEDETGIANAIVWQRIFEAHRRIILAAAMIGVHGQAPEGRRGDPCRQPSGSRI